MPLKKRDLIRIQRNPDLLLDLVMKILDRGLAWRLASNGKQLLKTGSGFARGSDVEIENRQHLGGGLIAKKFCLRDVFNPPILLSEYVGGGDRANRQLFEIRALIIA